MKIEEKVYYTLSNEELSILKKAAGIIDDVASFVDNYSSELAAEFYDYRDGIDVIIEYQNTNIAI